MHRSGNRHITAPEGYIYTTYGKPKYLRHAIASVISLRRYDSKRPVALACDEHHKQILVDHGLEDLFDQIHIVEPEHRSIVGFKHHVHKFMFFERNLFLDSDMVWCRDPDSLWTSLSPYDFTITGTQISDNFFGGPKNIGVIKDILLQRRRRTLAHFGLTYLNRVQTGVIYAQNTATTEKVCKTAQSMLDRKDETHFKSRTLEQGRSEESCEWSLAMAMSDLNIPIFPWLNGHESPQLDYISDYTTHDEDFKQVTCRYYSDQFVYSFRGIKTPWIRKLLTKLFSIIPGKGDFMDVTPYLLHFGWYHQKQLFFDFAERTWNSLIHEGAKAPAPKKKRLINTEI